MCQADHPRERGQRHAMNEIDDSELYTTWFSEVCCHCRHFNGDAPTHTCTAFPDGIPRAIWEGERTCPRSRL